MLMRSLVLGSGGVEQVNRLSVTFFYSLSLSFSNVLIFLNEGYFSVPSLHCKARPVILFSLIPWLWVRAEAHVLARASCSAVYACVHALSRSTQTYSVTTAGIWVWVVRCAAPVRGSWSAALEQSPVSRRKNNRTCAKPLISGEGAAKYCSAGCSWTPDPEFETTGIEGKKERACSDIQPPTPPNPHRVPPCYPPFPQKGYIWYCTYRYSYKYIWPLLKENVSASHLHKSTIISIQLRGKVLSVKQSRQQFRLFMCRT